MVTLLLLLAGPGRASASGTEGASFLDIPVGGRPASLGGAYSALAADAYAPVWNPAGLGRLRTSQLAAMHLEYAASIGYEFASFAQPLGSGQGLGAAVQYFHPKSMTERDVTGAETGAFSSHYAAYSLSYGRELDDGLSLGGAVKAVEARIGDASAKAFAADIGALYRFDKRLSVALVAANLGSRLEFLREGDDLPQAGRLGLAYAASPSWSLAVEGSYDRTKLAAGRLGTEWRPVPLMALRAGYQTPTTRDVPGLSGLTMGFGLLLFGQSFDYAWVPMGRLGQTQYFTITVSFGKGDRS